MPSGSGDEGETKRWCLDPLGENCRFDVSQSGEIRRLTGCTVTPRFESV